MDLRERQPDPVRRHPWEVARSRAVRRLVAGHVDLARCGRVLDVGAGDGWFAHELGRILPPRAEIVCWDVHYSPADLAAPVAAGVRRTIDPPAGRFDLVLLLDVLEHVRDDGAFLDDAVAPRLGGGGTLVVTVPAYQALFSAHDDMLGHERRYSPRALRELLGARFEIVERGGLFGSLLVPRAVATLLERLGWQGRAEGVGGWQRGRALTAAYTGALVADAGVGRWLARRGLAAPGLSTWAICRPRPAR